MCEEEIINELLVIPRKSTGSTHYFDIFSWRTSGRAGTVVRIGGLKEYIVSPFLIQSYMNGLTCSHLAEAVIRFENKRNLNVKKG